MLALRPSKLVPMALAAAVGLASAPARADGPSRWVAALPFGAGQFQNGDVALGIVFAASEAVMGTASIATVVLVNRLAATDLGRQPSVQRLDALNDSIHAAVVANRVTFTAWAALTVAGAIEAELSFAPRREAPARPTGTSVTAMAAPLPGGALLGVRGAF